jgi:hypothetical protein
MESQLQRGETSEGPVHLRGGYLWPGKKEAALFDAERLNFPLPYDARRQRVGYVGSHRGRFYAHQWQALLETEGLIDTVRLLVSSPAASAAGVSAPEPTRISPSLRRSPTSAVRVG